ncbi:TPA: ribonuclease III [Candidatus Falkowbacteria bacterium]|nr:ribonuclease III [Candidatus Falkowbacteria bacterium]
MEKDFDKFQKSVKLNFNNPKLLEQAFVHRSYLNEHRDFELEHNERLEFLGDAVLELVVTENLYNNNPNPEGELTNWRASLVNSKMLAKIAKKLNMEEYLYLSKGEQRDSGKARDYILANAMEALIGAVYLDKGWDEAKQFILDNVLSELPEILEKKLFIDPKTKFQEAAQEQAGITPAYKVIKEEGPDHNKLFEVGVYLNKELVATGTGSSKQEAQENAAEAAIEIKEWA